MSARDTWRKIQAILGTAQDGIPGPKDDAALKALEEAVIAESRGTKPQGIQSLRHINPDGLELVKHFEGRYLKAYQDSVGVWTIGYGHTGLTHNDGSVYRGREISEDQAENLLKRDMEFFEKRVSRLISAPLNDNQFSALVSFDFNTGGLGNSTLRKVLNKCDYEAAEDELLKWDKAGGRTLAGLTRRRESERRLFRSEKPYIVT